MLKAVQLVPAMEEGGVERYVVRLNRILVEAGWENVVVSCGGKLEVEIGRDGGRVVRLDLKSKNPLTALGRAWRLRRLLKRERPDVVCAHSRVPAWLFVLASRGLGLRWITYAHGANSISRYSRVMTRGDLVMCPSSFVRDYLREAYGTPAEKFRVVPHGIDAARFDPAAVDASRVEALRREWGVRSCERVVMSVGRITRLKGFDLLIRAFATLPVNTRLVIVGGAEKGKEAYLAELKALATALGVSERVVFAGAQARTAECLAIADVSVSANTVKPESFGLSMAESLAMGVPVVAKAFGGALDIVRDGVDGVLVRCEGCASSEREFAAAICRTLDHRNDFAKGAAIRASAMERFSMTTMERGTLACYGRAP